MKNYLIAVWMLTPIFSTAQTDVQNANHFYKSKNWQTASQLYEKITKNNPYQGKYWNRLGHVYLQLKDYEKAASAFHKAQGLLPFPGSAQYNLACSYALLNESEAALKWLQKAVQIKFVDYGYAIQDADLNSIKNLPEFMQIFHASKPENLARNEQWIYDLEFLVKIFENGHKNLFHTISREKWLKEVAQIKREIPELDDLEIVGKMMQLISKIGDGHSNIFPGGGKLYFPYMQNHSHAGNVEIPTGNLQVLPFDFEWFKDGIFIKGAVTGFEDLVGLEVKTINQVPVQKLLERAFGYIGKDNSMQGRQMGLPLLRLKSFYEWEKISEKGTSLLLKLHTKDGKILEKTIEAQTLKEENRSDWKWMNDKANKSKPIFLQDRMKNYFYRFLDDDKIAWLQYNQVRDDHNQSLEKFSEELFNQMSKRKTEYLIIDVRHNSGGNGFLNWSIIKRIIQNKSINQKGKLFLICGKQTFSAAMNFASQMERLTNVLFVGEPTGSRPNMYGEHNGFQLPFSGVQGSYSSRYFQGGFTSDDHRPWIAPDLVAEISSTEFSENIDPALRIIRKYIE